MSVRRADVGWRARSVVAAAFGVERVFATWRRARRCFTRSRPREVQRILGYRAEWPLADGLRRWPTGRDSWALRKPAVDEIEILRIFRRAGHPSSRPPTIAPNGRIAVGDRADNRP